MQSALVMGATGLVGSFVLEQLLADKGVGSVTVLGRKAPSRSHPKLQVLIADFDQLSTLPPGTFAVSAVFSCLGTTRKKTPDEGLYRKIEIDYPVAVAAAMLASGGTSFHYVSAVGVARNSPIVYSRLKAEAEERLQELQQRWPQACVASYRPSFIYGPRQEQRLNEQISIPIWRLCEGLMVGPLRKFRGIQAETIARAMVRRAQNPLPGFHLYESDQVQELGSTP